jgi:hypothetical protein
MTKTNSFKLEDIKKVEYKRIKDSPYRVGTTPIGAEPGEKKIYIGRSVPWKGKKVTEP